MGAIAAKLACEAASWYNEDLKMLCLANAGTLTRLANLCRRLAMDILPQDDIHRKHCNGSCDRWLPATAEYFPRDKSKKDGLRNQCKQCKSEKDKSYRERPDVHVGLLEKKRTYHARADVRERRRLRESTPEAREHRRIYRSQPEVRENERTYEETYHSQPEIQERYRINRQAYNSRPDIQERKRIYHSQPYVKAIYRTHSHKRRALKKNASGTHTPEQIEEQYDRQKGRCYYCQHKVEWGKHHIDHVIPLSRGGSNDISNIVIACSLCNLSKNNKLPHEWGKGGRLL